MKIKIQEWNRFIHVAVLVAGISITSLGLMAWDNSPGSASGDTTQRLDTIPEKEQKSGSVKDLDKELRQLEEATKKLQELRSNDWKQVQQDVEEAMKKIDVEKIRMQALAKIDMEKIGKEIEASLSKIDFNKIEQDIESAMTDISKIDAEKIKQELQKARMEVDAQLKKKEWLKEIEDAKKINMKEIGEEMENVKKEMARLNDELKLEKLDMKETMAKAYADIDKAKEELKGYQEMIYGMEKDGLLNTSQDYNIEFRKGELFINGKKQSTVVTNKYKKYFKKDPITIKKQNADLKIDMH